MQFPKRTPAFDLPNMVEGIFANKAIPTRPSLKRAVTNELVGLRRKDSISKFKEEGFHPFKPLETLAEEADYDEE